MVCLKYGVLIAVYFIGQVVSCTLRRDEYNKYPFMVKLAVNEEMRCHGALITPNFFITPYEPAKDIVDGHTYEGPQVLSNVTIVAVQSGANSAKRCADSVTPHLVRRAWKNRPDRNVAFWESENGFKIALNNRPYLFSDFRYLYKHVMEKNVEDTINNECCTLHVFNSKSLDDGNITEHKVTFIRGNLAKYWTKVFCENSSDIPQCSEIVKKDYLFAYSPSDMKKLWCQGAVMICNGNPLGILSAVVEDSASETAVVIEKLVFAASLLRIRVKENVPTDTPTTTKLS